MSIAEKKLELFIAAFVVLMLWGVHSLMKNWSGPRSINGDIVYEMPRPKSFQGTEFDLSDREIDRRFVNPFEKKKAEEAKAQAKGSAEKNAIAAKAAADAAKKVEAAKKAEADRRAKVTARIIEREKQAALAADAARKAQAQQQQQAQQQVAMGAGMASPNAPGTNNKEDNKRSPDQWRALISAQPTKANIDLMYAAVMKGELDQGSYFEITEDLLKSTKSETQSVGLYAASKGANSTAFALVATNEAHLNADVKSKVTEFYAIYTQVSRFGALAQALQSSDKLVVMQALNVVILAKKEGTVVGGTKTPDQVTTFSTTYSKAFDAILAKLVTSSDQEIASLAGSARTSAPSSVALN